jgi:hypothetical protein
MKNSNDIIGKRTRDVPACGAVPKPTALPRAPSTTMYKFNNVKILGARRVTWEACSMLRNYKYQELPCKI